MKPPVFSRRLAAPMVCVCAFLSAAAGCGGGSSDSVPTPTPTATGQGGTNREFSARDNPTAPVPNWAQTAFEKAVSEIRDREAARGTRNVEAGFALLRVLEDDLGYTHAHLGRMLGSLPVIGTDFVVTIQGGQVVDVSGYRDIDYSGLSTRPALTAGQAKVLYQGGTLQDAFYPNPADASLVVYAYESAPTLCWLLPDEREYAASVDEVVSYSVYLNAQTGALVEKIPNDIIE